MTRNPNLAVVALASVFAVAAFVQGALGLSEVFLLVTAITALGLWAWLRQRQLEGLTFRQRIVKGLIAYAIIGFILLIAFELGQYLGEHT